MNNNRITDNETVIKLAKSIEKYFEVLPEVINLSIDDLYNNFASAFLPLIEALKLTSEKIAILDYFAEQNIVFSSKIDDEIKKAVFDKNAKYFDNLLYKEEILFDKLYSDIVINKDVLEQSIATYYHKHYDICVVGLFSIIDGMLSNFFRKKGSTNSPERIDLIAEKINVLIKEQPESISNTIYTLTIIIHNINANTNFNEEEPLCINRHWVIHGRTKKRYSKKDCILIFKIIKALNILRQYMIDQ